MAAIVLITQAGVRPRVAIPAVLHNDNELTTPQKPRMSIENLSDGQTNPE